MSVFETLLVESKAFGLERQNNYLVIQYNYKGKV
jgi:hypothetical protein